MALEKPVELKVRSYINQQHLIGPGDQVVLGVSGGPDSVALLHILAAMRQDLDFVLRVAHVNHGLRLQADEEEEYVNLTCRILEVPFYSCSRDVRSLADSLGKTLEETGRDERYSFFREVCDRTGAQKIATAHHRDDVAETVLLHLLRGSGLKGLRGIMPRQGVLVRPLLCVDKQEILAFLKEKAIFYYQDESNEDCYYMRNRIRSELLPLLKSRYNNRMVESLNQLADIAREENQWLEELSESGYSQIVKPAGNDREELVIDILALQKAPTACQRRVIHLALSRLGGPAGWEMNDVEMVRNLQGKAGSSRVLYLKKGIRVRKVYQRLILGHRLPDKVSFCYPVTGLPVTIEIAETGQRYNLSLIDGAAARSEPGFYLDYDKIDHNLCVRSRQAGDRISPAGGKGSKKLKEYFIDLKLPSEERDRMVLLAAGPEVLAVIGHTISRKAVPDQDSRRFLAIKQLDQAN